jgi:hypothetical protein
MPLRRATLPDVSRHPVEVPSPEAHVRCPGRQCCTVGNTPAGDCAPWTCATTVWSPSDRCTGSLDGDLVQPRETGTHDHRDHLGLDATDGHHKAVTAGASLASCPMAFADSWAETRAPQNDRLARLGRRQHEVQVHGVAHVPFQRKNTGRKKAVERSATAR